MNIFTLPIALAALNVAVMIATPSVPAKASETNALLGGIVTGEVLCSLHRAGVTPEVATDEARRITLKLIEQGLITEADAPTYKRTIQSVFNVCPAVPLPDA